jgi:hypothetical protein
MTLTDDDYEFLNTLSRLGTKPFYERDILILLIDTSDWKHRGDIRDDIRAGLDKVEGYLSKGYLKFTTIGPDKAYQITFKGLFRMHTLASQVIKR